MVRPPSRTMVWPVRKPAPSETIQATQFGMYAYTATPAMHRRACSIMRQAAAGARA